jgi:parallel beta-helix repeat protein
VLDTTAPTSTHPADAVYEQGTVHTIPWTLSDNRAGGYYRVTRNGTGVAGWTAWASGVGFTIPVDTSTEVDWNYSIFYNDSSNNFGTPDEVFITITLPNEAPAAVLNAPEDFYSLEEGVISFSYIPTDDRGFKNATLWGNFSGSWDNTGVTNATPLSNNSMNSISLAVSRGYYEWNIEVCDKHGLCSFAPSNFTLHALEPIDLAGVADGSLLVAPGYYYLTGNRTRTGVAGAVLRFDIGASGSVVDCAGFTINSSPAYTAIGVDLYSSATEVSHFRVVNCSFAHFDTGLQSQNTPGLIMTDTVFYDNWRYGAKVDVCMNCTLANNQFDNNRMHGIALGGELNGTVLSNSTASYNDNTGIYIGDSGYALTIDNVTASYNSVGFRINLEYGLLSNVVAEHNSNYGVHLMNSAGHWNFSNSILKFNGDSPSDEAGLFLESAFSNSFSDLDVSENVGRGVFLLDADNNRFWNITTNGNSGYGFYSDSDAENNLIQNSTSCNNLGDGFPFDYYIRALLDPASGENTCGAAGTCGGHNCCAQNGVYHMCIPDAGGLGNCMYSC